jgi:tRNA pseudouridine55 synthase
MHGVLILDKPQGPPCQKILSKLRKAISLKKVGYSGTLDPFATGVLPIFVGAATKLIPYIDEGKKVYEALLRLGEATDTLDCTGTIIEKAAVPPLEKNSIEELFQTFLGSRLQTPPSYSAVKVKGKPLYRYARQGISVEANPRPIEIFSLDLIDFDSSSIRFEVEVSRGTYIRSLASEISRALGTVGHLAQLKRLRSGPFCIEKAMSAEQFDELLTRPHEFIHPMSIYFDQLLVHFHRIEVSHSVVQRILHGEKILIEDTNFGATDGNEISKGGRFLLFNDQKMLSIAEYFISDEQKTYLKPLRVLDLPFPILPR